MRNGVTLKLFLTVRSCLHSERCLLTIPDKSKNSNSYHTAVVKICSIQGKPKLQEQETEKHICTSAQTHTTSTHGYCGSTSCTQHHKSHTNISDNGTQPLKGKWIGCVFSGGDQVLDSLLQLFMRKPSAETRSWKASSSQVLKQEAEKHPCNLVSNSLLIRTLSSDCELSSTETRSWEASL